MQSTSTSQIQAKSPIALQAIYENREEILHQLSTQRSISLSNASGLDRGGLCRLADDHWGACSEELRQSMLNHQHHSVRSCAVIAQQDLLKASDGVIKDQSRDALKMRLRDLNRQHAEWETNDEFQEQLSVPHSPEILALVESNVMMNQVRHRLKHHFGFCDPRVSGNWMI